MANKTYYLRGIIDWAKVNKPDPKFDVYTLDLTPDEDSFKLFEESGLQLKLREGKNGTFIKLRRAVSKKKNNELVQLGPPQVVLKNEDGTFSPFTGNIGNGSIGVCKVRVYDTPKGPGHELVTVAVEKLEVYDEAVTANDEEFPF
jgi:hypothetical protein